MDNQIISDNSFCFIVKNLKFSINGDIIKDICYGTRGSWTFCDESKKYSMIISFNPKTKMIHLKPLIRELKEYEIFFDELMNNLSFSCVRIPVTFDEISENIIQSKKQQPFITIIEPELNWGNVEYFQSRKILHNDARKKLAEKFGSEKSDEQLSYLDRLEELNYKQKILLERKLGIIDPQHSRSNEELEDLISQKRHLKTRLGEAIIEKMNFKEYEELYNFYLKLSQKFEEKRVMYKLAKLIEHRQENERKYGGCKSLEELDELLRKEDFPQKDLE